MQGLSAPIVMTLRQQILHGVDKEPVDDLHDLRHAGAIAHGEHFFAYACEQRRHLRNR